MAKVGFNTISRFTRIEPNIVRTGFFRVNVGQGAQVLRLPLGSLVKDLTLAGGASHASAWAVLRGAVLKLNPQRKNPITIDGQGLVVPTGHTLMDLASLEFTRTDRNQGKPVPHLVVDNISPEPLYLVHASYCHPNELFLAQGAYSRASFSNASHGYSHGQLEHDSLYLREQELPRERAPFDLVAGMSPQPEAINILLQEGGLVRLEQV